MLEELFLYDRQQMKYMTAIGCPTYKAYRIELGDFCVEAQAFSDPSHVLSNILRVSCFGSIEDQGAARLLRICHGSYSL